MVVLIESVVGIFLFTIIIVLVTLKDPIASVGDYPPAIRKKCMELGLVEERKKRFTKGDIVRKTAAMLVFIAALSWTLKCFNGAQTFWQGFNSRWPFYSAVVTEL